MYMEEGEIARNYRQSAHPWEQITVLADLNGVSRKDIIDVLLSQGINPFAQKPGKLGVLLNAEEADLLYELLSLALNKLKKHKIQFENELYVGNQKLMDSVIKKLIKVK